MADPSRTASVGDGLDGLKRVGPARIRAPTPLKNVVTLEHYYTPWAVERAVARFVEDYNHRRYHEALQNVTPADVFHGRQAAILARRARIKQRTLQQRKRENLHVPPHGGHSLGSISLKTARNGLTSADDVQDRRQSDD